MEEGKANQEKLKYIERQTWDIQPNQRLKK